MAAPLKHRCLAELFGTFCLVFAGTGASIVDQVTHGKVGVLGIGIVFGLIVFVMIALLGNISGAHINPAVTLGFFAKRKHPGKEVVPYIIFQVLGAAVASCLLQAVLIHTSTNLGMTFPSGPACRSFVLEFVLTFILMTVILGVSTGDHEEGLFAAITIGATVGLEAIFAGPICGASMNPARSIGPALILRNFRYLWIYCTAPPLGSTAAAYLHSLI